MHDALRLSSLNPAVHRNTDNGNGQYPQQQQQQQPQQLQQPITTTPRPSQDPQETITPQQQTTAPPPQSQPPPQQSQENVSALLPSPPSEGKKGFGAQLKSLLNPKKLG